MRESSTDACFSMLPSSSEVNLLIQELAGRESPASKTHRASRRYGPLEWGRTFASTGESSIQKRIAEYPRLRYVVHCTFFSRQERTNAAQLMILS